MNSSVLTVTLLALLFGMRQPLVDTDVSHWDTKRFQVDSSILEISAPIGYRVRTAALPQRVYKRAQRLLLDLQYDFVRQGSDETSQFQIKVDLVRLVAPFNTEFAKTSDLDSALAEAFGHPINGDKSPAPAEQLVRGRRWIYYDNSADVTYGQTRETYGTVIDTITVLLITGWYGPNLRKDPKWFGSRRQILREVRNNTKFVE